MRTMPRLSVRQLPVEEWAKLRGFGHFQKVGGLPNADHAHVLVLESEGEIVGTWMARDIVLLESLHLEPAFRGNPAAARKLFFGMVDHLKTHQVGQAITVTQDVGVRVLADKAGFEIIPGSLHLLTLKGAL